MRLFLAIEIDEKIKKQIRETMKQIMNRDFDIAFVGQENLHFTVKFLGEVDESALPEIESLVLGAVKKFEPFRISVENIGYFGGGSHVKVIWVDVKENRDKIIRLMNEVNDKLRHIRWEERESTPHVTIGRVKSGRNSDKLIEKLREISHVKFGEMDVKYVKLKSSTLTKTGSIYSDVKQFRLGE